MIAGHLGKRALALSYTNYLDMYLGVGTLF